MNEVVHNEVGLIHLISSVLALVFGTWILMSRKGTSQHRKVGYAYVFSMTVLLITAFMLYNLFGGFGIFHFAAVVSSVTLFMGLLPLYKRHANWILHHFCWMYWSVFGLYGAFASEIFTRFLPRSFFSAVGIATGLVMMAGAIGFRRNLKKWEKQFSTWTN